MSNQSRTPRQRRIRRAERRVLLASMHITDAKGWAFNFQGDGGVPVVCRPGALRGLESAIASLKAEKRKRK